MAHCININHPEYKKLVPQFKGPEALLKAKISIWQENNGLDNFPTIDQLEERKNILYDKMSIEEKIQKELTIEQNKKVSENVLKVVADKLTKRTNIPYNIVNYEDIKDKYENIESTTKGFYAPDEKAIYFIRGNFTLETAFHEFAHPIVDRILYRNNKLYNELKDELLSDSYIDTFKEIIKTYTLEDYKFDTTVTQEELNNYNDDELFKFFEELPKDVRIGLLSEGITNVWGQESEKWIDKKTGKVNLKLAEDSSLVRLWKTIVEWFKDFIRSGNVEDITPNTSFRKLGKLLAIDDSKFNLDVIKQNEVQYNLKAVDILLSDKAKQVFEKGNKNNWSIDKILQESAIPKEQKELVIDSYNNGNKTPEDIAIDIADKYSFVVKSEVVKDKKSGDFVISDDLGYPNEFGDSRYHEIGRPTQYYSNLTVPGGTNYTENEISTPLITPSIKGHAQFSTDKGIGWFRSDDRIVYELKGNWIKSESELPNEFIFSGEKYFKEDGKWQTKSKFIEDIETVIWRYNMSLGNERIQNKSYEKTRRILEIQSDLFQKGRDKDNLISGKELQDNYNVQYNDNIETFYDADNDRYFKIENGKETTITEKEFNTINSPKESSKNQFLQLLNKDNNWVTFFIKSIIQYLAKQTVTEVQESDVEAKVRELEKFGELEIDCSKVKAKNGIRSKFTKGSKWEIVKDLKGYPSHAHGGVDIKLGKDGFSFTGKDGIIKVAYGLVLPKIK